MKSREPLHASRLRAEHTEKDGLHTVTFHDMRYAGQQESVSSLWPLTVIFDADGKPVLIATVKDGGPPPVISSIKLKPEPARKPIENADRVYGIHEAGPITSETLRRLERESGGALVLIDENLLDLDTRLDADLCEVDEDDELLADLIKVGTGEPDEDEEY